MLNADVRQSLEDAIINVLQEVNDAEVTDPEREMVSIKEKTDAQQARTVGIFRCLQESLNEFNKTDLEELKEMDKFELEKLKLHYEHEEKMAGVTSEKLAKKRRLGGVIGRICGIAVPFLTELMREVFKVNNLKRGYKFEMQDVLLTSPTFKTVWQKM